MNLEAVSERLFARRRDNTPDGRLDSVAIVQVTEIPQSPFGDVEV